MTTNNSTPFRTVDRNRKGGVLIGVIAVMLIVGVMGVSVISLTHSSEHSHLSANARSRAYYLAESGLRYAQQIHCEEFAVDEKGWLHGRQRTLSLQGGEQVDVIRIVDNFWATAVVDASTAQEARARVPMPLSLCGVDPNAPPSDEFAIFGEVGIALGNNTIIQGNVAITDDNVEIKGDVEGSVLANDVEMTSSDSTVTGDIYSSGSVDIKAGTVIGDIHSANGIIIGSAQSTVVEGWLFSNGSIEVGGGGQVGGHIHSCGGDVSISGSAIIGTAAKPIEIRATGDVTITGSAVVYGTVYAGGSIVVGGTINGNAYAGGTISNSGTITGEALESSPSYVEAAICPDLSNLDDLELPDATVFTAGGDDVSVPAGTEAAPIYYLAPGTYGDLSTLNNASNTQLSLNAGSTSHGNYYFDSVSLGSNMTLYLNLSGDYDIQIFVVGDIDIRNQLNVFVSTDGTTYYPMRDAAVDPLIAARVYWESHGDYALDGVSNWFGSVYAPNGLLSVGSGSNTCYLIGSYFSGAGHSIAGSTVVHVAPNYLAEE
jgi:cytoskeletal protein CcmA (bactofilin family)